jgi:hypothetical protein
MAKDREIITLREFGRRMGVDEKTIRRSIETQKIVKGFTKINDKPKIIFELAKLEFEQMNIGAKARYGIEEQQDNETRTAEYVDEEFLDGSAPIGLAQRMKAIAEANIKLREDALMAKSMVRVDELTIQLNELMSSIRKEFESMPVRAAGKIHLICGGNLVKITEIILKEVGNSLIRVNNECSINKVLLDEDS